MRGACPTSVIPEKPQLSHAMFIGRAFNWHLRSVRHGENQAQHWFNRRLGVIPRAVWELKPIGMDNRILRQCSVRPRKSSCKVQSQYGNAPYRRQGDFPQPYTRVCDVFRVPGQQKGNHHFGRLSYIDTSALACFAAGVPHLRLERRCMRRAQRPTWACLFAAKPRGNHAFGSPPFGGKTL